MYEILSNKKIFLPGIYLVRMSKWIIYTNLNDMNVSVLNDRNISKIIIFENSLIITILLLLASIDLLLNIYYLYEIKCKLRNLFWQLCSQNNTSQNV